ncbi:hypothetical protein MTO96_039031 [Rhipicephalus appendiculatus]
MYIRSTTVLKKLSFIVSAPMDAAPLSCWTLVFDAISANTTISNLVVSSSDNLVYNDHFAATIGFSRCITRLLYITSKPEWNPTGFVVRLSESIGDNFNLLDVDLCHAKVDAEAKHCLFTIRETTRRNCGQVERAAAFNRLVECDSGLERPFGGRECKIFLAKERNHRPLHSLRGGDTSGIVERGGLDRNRPTCTAHRDQICQIHNILPNCNELLFDIGLELREEGGGQFSLRSIEIPDANLTPTPSPDSYRATPFLRWLLRTHVCISSLELIDNFLKSHSEIILSELPQNCPLKKLTLTLYEDDAVYTYTATVLPRLRSLEVLNCFIMCRSSDALVGAVSALLRTTTCLRSLVYHATDDNRQPPKSFVEALAANSTLKSLELVTDWATDDPPGPLGEYVRNNRLLTSLSVSGHYVDRAELLLDEALLHNGTLSTLEILNACGGETTVRFLTRLLAECYALKELDICSVRAPFIKISEATLNRCAEALAKNESLEVLTLPYSLWHPNNWIAFFALLPRGGKLKRLNVTEKGFDDYATFPPVLEALERTNSSTQVSFGHYLHGYGINFMHFRVFSRICLSGEESIQVDALQRLLALDHLTDLSLSVYNASKPVFCALAKYIRETTVLQKLSLTVTKPYQVAHTAAWSCWAPLFESMSANTSVSDLDIYSNGNFQHNDHLSRIIRLSRYISRVSFLLNAGDGTATDFVSLLSEAIGDNCNLLNVDLYNSKVGVEAKRCLLKIRETTRRNSGLLERAAAFNKTSRLDWYTATALEKVSRYPALLRELAKKEDIAVRRVASLIRSRLSSVDGLNDFMRLTGVVKKCVTCAPPVNGCGMQLQDISYDCWCLVRRYLSFDDVKRFTISKPDHSAS